MKHVWMGTALLGSAVLAGCFSPPETPTADACGAQTHAGLVGEALPKAFAPPDPSRVFRSGDPLTMDFVEHRLNIELDPQTGKVVRVFCG